MIQNPDAERALLGCIILAQSGESLVPMMSTVSERDFYAESHREIFRAMVNVWESTQTVGLVLLTTELRNAGTLATAGGSGYVSRLATVASTPMTWRHDHGILEDCRRRREIVSTATKMSALADGGDPFEAAEEAISELSSISGEAPTQTLPSWSKTGLKFVDWMEANAHTYNQIGRSPQWTIGWDAINEVVPLYPGKSLILAGASGSGKTGLALQALMATAVENGESGMFISLEMSAELAYLRALSRRIDIAEHKMMRGDFSEQDYQRVCDFSQHNGRLPLIIDADCPRDVGAVDRRIRAAAKSGVKWVAIDYLQLLRWPGRKFDRLSLEYGDITYRLHRTAQRAGIGLCILGQLRKTLDGVVPTHNDLKDGGDSVMAVDVVSMMWRPGDLPKEEAERREKSGETISDDTMRINTSKHRYGSPCGGAFGWSQGRVVPMGENWQSWASKLDDRNHSDA
mgnify:FL=1|tara:strand:- start:293 stop:1666 length:1374 start_codon:yes stop_codon:yes gene_type:complete